MVNNMVMLREYSGLKAKELARLLNVTTHTYIAYEQERMTIPTVIQIMLGRIYALPSNLVVGESISNEDLQTVSKLKELSEEERHSIVVTRQFGEKTHVSYHRVSKLKEEILYRLSSK